MKVRTTKNTKRMKKNKCKKIKITRKLIIKWIKEHVEENSFLFFLRDLRVLRGKIRIALGKRRALIFMAHKVYNSN